MKKHYLFYLALAATSLFTACSSEEPTGNEPTEGTPVTFTIGEGGAVTRTSTTEESNGYKTVFVAGESVGIYATGAASGTNVAYTVSADGSKLESSNGITIANSGPADFNAYSPYSATAADTYEFTVNTDQTTADKFNASNLLTAKCEGVSAASPTVSLVFKPRLAILRIEMTGSLGATTSAITVNAKATATWTKSTDAISDATGEAKEIKMYKQTTATADAATSQVFTAFVPAQQIAGASAFLTMAVGDKNYSFKPKTSFDLQAGRINKIRINIGANGEVTVESMTINVQDWEVNELNIEGDLEEIVPEPAAPIVLIDDVANAPAAEALQSCTGLVGTKEGWNALLANATATTISYDETEAAFKIADDGTGAWYQKMLVFRTPNNAGSLAKYELTFQVKTTNGKDITVRAMKGQVKDVFTANAYFNTNDAWKTSGQSLGTSAGAWASKKITIDLSVLEKNPATTDDLAYGVMVCFAIKTVTDVDDIYIKDVKCVEVTE